MVSLQFSGFVNAKQRMFLGEHPDHWLYKHKKRASRFRDALMLRTAFQQLAVFLNIAIRYLSLFQASS